MQDADTFKNTEDKTMIKKRTFLKNVSAGLVAGTALSAWAVSESNAADTAPRTAAGELKLGEIQHMVIFNLKHDKKSVEAQAFLQNGRRILSVIPGVRNFQVFTQVSKKNDYDYGFSMVFSDGLAYEKYSLSPDHVRFVEEHWKKEVSRFLEIDFTCEA